MPTTPKITAAQLLMHNLLERKKSAQKCTKMYKNAQKCTKMHKNAQKYTKVLRNNVNNTVIWE